MCWPSCSSDKLKLTHFTSDSHSNIVSQSDAFVRSTDFEISLCLGCSRCGIIPSALRHRSISSRACLAPCTCLSHPYLTADTTTEQPSPDHNSSSEQPSSAFSWSLFFESTAFLSFLLTPLLPLNSFLHPTADISYSITAYFSLLLIKTLSLNSLPQLSADITYSTTA